MSRSRVAVCVLGGLAGLALLAVFAGRAGGPDVPVGPARGVAAVPPVAAPAPGEAERPGPASAARPPSLRGTEVAGALRVDTAGHFVPDRGALELFEYYLSATGEVADAELRAWIVSEIEGRLEPPAVAEAIAFLDRTLAYRAEAESLFAAGAFPASLERRFQRIRELRREIFGAELSARLFGTEEQTLQVDLEARRIARDDSLGDAERAERLAALEERLPSEVRESRRRSRAALDLREEEDSLRAEGAGEGELWALRAQRFGPEAAERLAVLDRDRANWDARVPAYREARAALRGENPNVDQNALDALRAEHFAGAELLRVEALERSAGR